MTRRLLKLCVFLLLGAIVNVAVAWACVWRASSFIQVDSMIRSVRRTVWHDEQVETTAASFGVRLEEWGGSITTPSRRLIAGYPLDIVQGACNPDMMPWLNHKRDPQLVLKLRQPHWIGFAVNTLFYAAVLWLLVAAPFTLRRHLRIRRKLCPHCAYPVGTSDVCTECGYAMAARLQVPYKPEET
jgi:hypothetical protein